MNIFPQFGRTPRGARKQKILNSPNYKNGAFVNIDLTPNISKEFSITKLMKEYISPSAKERIPKIPLQNTKTDLNNLSDNCVVWFGHSSYLLRIDSMNILVDPVFSQHASPFPFGPKAFDGSNIYIPQDMPYIDLLIITHDHYDHMDYKTLLALKSKVAKVVTGLGVGEHLEYWGYDADKIVELDWYEGYVYDDVQITSTPARHFSGRFLTRNNTLWSSFILKNSNRNIYIGGDSGYGSHFNDIGKKYGPFDLSILECGQYNEMWSEIHILPKDMSQAISDLNTKNVIPVHRGKFALALHNWHEPIDKISDLDIGDTKLIVPKIGMEIKF